MPLLTWITYARDLRLCTTGVVDDRELGCLSDDEGLDHDAHE